MACQDNIAQVGVSVKLALNHSQVLSENSAVITFFADKCNICMLLRLRAMKEIYSLNLCLLRIHIPQM